MTRPLAFDPYLSSADALELGVELVSLPALLERADFVSIHCPLNDQTRNLITARQLALMKRDAYLINTARGGIVDEDALYEALATGASAGLLWTVLSGSRSRHRTALVNSTTSCLLPIASPIPLSCFGTLAGRFARVCSIYLWEDNLPVS